MPALTQITPTQFLNTIMPEGEGAQFGVWTVQSLTDYEANSLVSILGSEFDYASDLLTAASLAPATLTQAQWNIATMAMVYGIAYQLLQLDEVTQTTISDEVQGGIRQSAYNSRNTQFHLMAQQKWSELGIASKYYFNFTSGCTTSQSERVIINYNPSIHTIDYL